jgi:predicted RNA methylase
MASRATSWLGTWRGISEGGLRGKRVLELGAGTGIVGMVASLLGTIDRLTVIVVWCADSK